MSLQKIAHFNDLSPELKEILEKKIASFGKMVRYKFDISHPNPDPTHHNGKILYPNVYTLDPAVWNIYDKSSADKSKHGTKRIALIDGVDEKGLPNKFKKIRIHERQKGVLKLELHENPENIEIAMAIELHPKLQGGMFSDVTKKQVITRIDEHADAIRAREERSARSKARRAAEEMTIQEVVDFCDAMMWDSTDDEFILRNQVEELAETNPEMFNELVEGKSIEYQAVVKQALDRNIVLFDPAEDKYSWASNKQTIALLQNLEGKNHVQRLAEYLQAGTEKETKVFEKMKAAIKGKELVG